MTCKTNSLRYRILGILLLSSVSLFSGCGEKVVYNKSVAQLNQKAQALISQGDYAGAVGRLEAARDLNPDEPNTLYNLGVAYQSKGDLDKSIETFETLLQKPGVDAPRVNQSLGVVYEEKADSLLGKEDPSPDSAQKPKATPAQMQDLQAEAVADYQKAIEAYRKAASGASGDAKVSLENQALSLEKKIQELQTKQPV